MMSYNTPGSTMRTRMNILIFSMSKSLTWLEKSSRTYYKRESWRSSRSKNNKTGRQTISHIIKPREDLMIWIRSSLSAVFRPIRIVYSRMTPPEVWSCVHLTPRREIRPRRTSWSKRRAWLKIKIWWLDSIQEWGSSTGIMRN